MLVAGNYTAQVCSTCRIDLSVALEAVAAEIGSRLEIVDTVRALDDLGLPVL